MNASAGLVGLGVTGPAQALQAGMAHTLSRRGDRLAYSPAANVTSKCTVTSLPVRSAPANAEGGRIP